MAERYMGQSAREESEEGGEFDRLLDAPVARSAVEETIRAEVDVQISTAKRYPRSLAKSMKRATEMACLNESVAASMFYVVPRSGKNIEGPSIRLAEVVANAWGNMRFSADVVSMDDEFVTARGTCHDLECNVAASVQVKRRITDRDGRKFNADMIGTTSNAACAIALRNALFKVVPFSIVSAVYHSARKVAIGDVKSMVERRNIMFAWFQKAGVHPPTVMAKIGVAGIEEVTMDHLATLIGLKTAIESGETTIEDAFAVEAPEAKAPEAATRTESVAAKIRNRKTAAPVAEERQPGEDREEDVDGGSR